MKLFIFIYALLVVMSGIASLGIMLAAAIIGRNVRHISYSPRSENEAEYGIRSLLFLYPKAVIKTPENAISKKLSATDARIILDCESEITAHQAT